MINKPKLLLCTLSPSPNPKKNSLCSSILYIFISCFVLRLFFDGSYFGILIVFCLKFEALNVFYNLYVVHGMK